MKRIIIVLLLTILTVYGFSVDFLSQQEVVKIGKNNKFKEHAQYMDISEKSAIIPGLKEGYVPQGIAYIEKENCFVISAYKDGTASILTLADATDGKMIKTLIICNNDGSHYTGHAGGVAVSKKNIWISSGSKIRKIPLAYINETKDGEKVHITQEFDAYTNASFITFYNNVLWVGEFFHDNNYLTDISHYLTAKSGERNHSWIAGFILDDDEKPSDIPDYIISIPDIVQGVAFSANGNIAISQSYGRGNDSTIQIHENILKNTPYKFRIIEGKEIPIWVLSYDSLINKITVYPMSEGIIILDDFLYVLYESATKKYRLTTRYATEHIWKTPLSSILKK